MTTPVRAGSDRTDVARSTNWSTRAALVCFVAVLGGALLFYVHVGRHYWFLQDDWDFLIGRQGGGVQNLFRESHEHWTTVPILVYRLFWDVFGLRYRPYLALIVLLHLTVAVLLRVVMRRVGVGPWIATATALMFALLAGSGWNNIVWSFQIGFVASLVCGLAHLLLADHDGAVDRRDVIGMGLGVIGLMSSGVGVTMVAVVGLAVLIRRGWRAAALHTAPFAAIYLAWYFAFPRRSYRDSGGSISIGNAARFDIRGLVNALDRMVRVPAGAFLLATMIVVGLALAWRNLPRAVLRRRAAMPVALLAGALLFITLVAIDRSAALTTVYATTSRFVHVVTALLAPAIAVAADALCRRWRVLTPAFVVLLLIGVPRNVQDLRRAPPSNSALVHALAGVPDLEKVPRSVHPLPARLGLAQITVGWLLDGVAAGKIEPSRHPRPDIAADALLRVALQERDRAGDTAPCSPLRKGTRTLEVGGEIKFRGAVLVRLSTSDGGKSSFTGMGSQPGKVAQVKAVLGPLQLWVAPYTHDTVECR